MKTHEIDRATPSARSTILTLMIALLALGCATTARGEKVARLPIVDQAIAHHGGDRYTSSETSYESCSKSGCSQVRARVDGGVFSFTVEGPTANGPRRVHMTNDTTAVWLDGLPRVLDADLAQRRRDWAMQRVYFAFLPFRLNDPDVWKEDLGLETWGDRQLHRVRISFSPGSSTDADDTYAYWFDPETGAVVFFAYRYAGDPGGIRFRRAIDPRRVGGILFFDQENYGAEGDALGVDMITPSFAEGLRLVSTVRFVNVVIEDLR